MKKYNFFLCYCFCTIATGQIKIGDNPQNIDPSSVLELESNDHVFVLTRINTNQMNSIFPSSGALAYNTDKECLYFYNGFRWKNLCSSFDLNLSTEPLVNPEATVILTEIDSTLTLEVGEITGNNIADYSIKAIDIDNNSITEEALSSNSVGTEELQGNSVGDSEINYDQVTIKDFINDAGYITDARIVSPEANNSITNYNGAFFDATYLSESIASNRLEITNNAEALALIRDNDSLNEIQNLEFSNNTLYLSQANSVDLSSLFRDQQNLTSATLNSSNILEIHIENGSSASVDLSELQAQGEDNQKLQLDSENILTLEEGGYVDLSTYLDNTDQQSLEEFTFDDASKVLSLTLENGGTEEVDLSSLASGSGTANPLAIDVPFSAYGSIASTNVQNALEELKNELDSVVFGGDEDSEDELQDLQLNGTILSLSNPSTADNYVDLSPFFEDSDADPNNEIQSLTSTDGSVVLTQSGNNYNLSVSGGGTDNQNILGSGLREEVLTIGIENGASESVSLAPFALETELAQAISVSETKDRDTDSTNEIQNLSLITNTLRITNNNDATPIDLTKYLDNTDEQSAASVPVNTTPTNYTAISADVESHLQGIDAALTTVGGTSSIIISSPTVAVSGNGTTSDPYVLESTRVVENQNLMLDTSTNNLTLSGGNSVNLSSFLDNRDEQTLILNGHNLEISNGNSVLLPREEIISSSTITVSGEGSLSDPYVLSSLHGSNLASADLIQTGGNRSYNLNNQELYFIGSGNIGIGKTNPQNKLDVAGEIRSQGYSNSNGTATEPSYAFSNDSDTGMWRGRNANYLRFSTKSIEAMTIDPDQQMGIGINAPSEKLDVAGNIRASGDFISAATMLDVPDYVFETYYSGNSQVNQEYRFYTLDEMESYLKEHQHLPGISSAWEVEKSNKWNITNSTLKNLEKIEELFLYTINQEKRIKAFEKDIKGLKNEIVYLRKDLKLILQFLANYALNNN